MLDLRNEIRTEVAQFPNRSMCCGVGGHCQESIVPLSLPVFSLLRFDDTHESRRYDTPGKHGRIHKDEDVERIAVLRTRGRHETEVERKTAPAGSTPLSTNVP